MFLTSRFKYIFVKPWWSSKCCNGLIYNINYWKTYSFFLLLCSRDIAKQESLEVEKQMNKCEWPRSGVGSRWYPLVKYFCKKHWFIYTCQMHSNKICWNKNVTCLIVMYRWKLCFCSDCVLDFWYISFTTSRIVLAKVINNLQMIYAFLI